MSLRSMSALLLRRCLGRGLHDDVAAVGAGHGALHEQQPALGIDPHHRELLYGALDVPVLTRIRLPGNTRPGSWAMLIEPGVLCDSELPCEARFELKL